VREWPATIIIVYMYIADKMGYHVIVLAVAVAVAALVQALAGRGMVFVTVICF
jgi:hypothetical protein